jgi:hypothetical protein
MSAIYGFSKLDKNTTYAGFGELGLIKILKVNEYKYKIL